ncbi:unnamed protein product [Sphagnum compactum]
MTLLLEIELHRILDESENMLLGIMQAEFLFFFLFCWKLIKSCTGALLIEQMLWTYGILLLLSSVEMLLLFLLLEALIKSSSKVKKNSSSAPGSAHHHNSFM